MGPKGLWLERHNKKPKSTHIAHNKKEAEVRRQSWSCYSGCHSPSNTRDCSPWILDCLPSHPLRGNVLFQGSSLESWTRVSKQSKIKERSCSISFAVINSTTTTTKSQPVEEKNYFISHLQLRVRQDRNSRRNWRWKQKHRLWRNSVHLFVARLTCGQLSFTALAPLSRVGAAHSELSPSSYIN